MKQTITVEQAVIAYNAMNVSKLTKLSADGQVSALKFLRAARPIADDYQKFVEATQKKARAKEIDMEAFQQALKEENQRKLSLEYDRISAEDVKTIYEKNENLTGSEMLAIEDTLRKSDKA